MKNFFLVLIVLAALIVIGLLISPIRHGIEPIPNNTSTITAGSSTTTSPTHNTDDSIEVTSPTPNLLIHSPFHIIGKAKNFWYFSAGGGSASGGEGQFPVELLDSAGTLLAQAPAQAEGDSTAPGFIPFSLTLNFPAPTTTTGLLIFKNDNSSGDPSKDIILAIPVRFK